MEKYCGVKFFCRKIGDVFSFDNRIEKLNYWCWMFSQVGLTPVHREGAYGNMSCRFEDSSFVITKTGMIPTNEFRIDNFALVETFDREEEEFRFIGRSQPSSESFLHDCIYSQYEGINAVLHGHSILMNERAADLGIQTTSRFYDYGTQELADSALEILSMEGKIIILKDHGFVAMGRSIEEAGCLVLQKYRDLLSCLSEEI